MYLEFPEVLRTSRLLCILPCGLSAYNYEFLSKWKGTSKIINPYRAFQGITRDCIRLYWPIKLEKIGNLEFRESPGTAHDRAGCNLVRKRS